MPVYLKARAAAGHALPIFEVVLPQSQQQQGEEQQAGVLGKRKAADEQDDAAEIGVVQDEKHAMLEYVVKELNEELVTELLEGFHS
jgi:restriction endonuclease Mrr